MTSLWLRPCTPRLCELVSKPYRHVVISWTNVSTSLTVIRSFPFVLTRLRRLFNVHTAAIEAYLTLGLYTVLPLTAILALRSRRRQVGVGHEFDEAHARNAS